MTLQSAFVEFAQLRPDDPRRQLPFSRLSEAASQSLLTGLQELLPLIPPAHGLEDYFRGHLHLHQVLTPVAGEFQRLRLESASGDSTVSGRRASHERSAAEIGRPTAVLGHRDPLSLPI